ncbi:type VI secretion system contractile sheath large subunit [Rubinisphaera sp.]|uniref:type VI secretion system contractile sheath large subunit n=1 Tax=Rubinisphaera sp. TaxID=2024857 RepID=UPI000C10096A|nr:type VI secretion system contractile sheath large subunit [Rubinisphaera sp.]MBV10870.1 type VI secretion system contractile sheath large subunit [Rubinisphaera sp.]HCS52497.1 type VI secretion system contractile sheath large subunit [Planctomycetaceae bacterium]
MSASEETKTDAAAVETTEQSVSLLDQAIAVTKATDRSRAEELLSALTTEALKGTVRFDKSITATINNAIAAIDQTLSEQLAVVLHHPKFQKLEGSWRGLHHLISQSETGQNLKIKVIDVSKKELFKDLDKAVEFDQSQLFKKMYENEFGSPGGEPYAALIGDYEFSSHPQDLSMLEKISNVAAAAFCPFVTAADPALFGFDTWTELASPRDLEKIFDSAEYAKWRSFRESEDSRFVTMTMPRVLSRLPYGAGTSPVEEFDFEEVELDAQGNSKPVSHDQYTWMNASYVMGTNLTRAFSKYGWCTAIRGAEGGGKVEGLPTHIFKSDDGDTDMKCPTELAITDRREAELSKLGFLPLCHYKNTDYSVFFGGQTTQKPKKYDDADATANAAISARLPYIMATARFAHYLKVMARDKIGSFMEVTDCEEWLNRWITNYVTADPKPSEDTKARYPLREARVSVQEIPGAPGSYNAVAHLRPWLQMEELTTSLRMVAKIPQLG